MGDLAASVAHELNQPLNSMKMIAQSIIRYLKEYDEIKIRSDLGEIVDTVNKMAKIIDHMGIFARRSNTEELINLT